MADVRNYSPAYGGVPVLQTPQELQSQLTGIINTAIPGYSGLSQQGSNYISQLMSGKLPTDVQNAIQDKAATYGVTSGMPGSGLARNRSLRDLGLTSLQAQQTGFGDLVNFLQGSSGTSALTPGQLAEQQNAAAQYAAAPDPMAAALKQIQTYKDLYNWQQEQQDAENKKTAAATAASLPVSGGNSGPDLWIPWTIHRNGGMVDQLQSAAIGVPRMMQVRWWKPTFLFPALNAVL